ncbi:hypothetical protein OG301_01105 [Streptomyces platensis]|uniref:hypothetical protein n=1 Tax=Streptomyces platensis TaxID=58346 RepID=UPI002ED17338|nr:hypothetical protein OG301_01105 [Streptomyces platensis]
MDELSPPAARLRVAMAGPQPDADWSGGLWSACAQLTAEELGALLPTAYRTLRDEHAPEYTRRVAREVTWAKVHPSFTAAALALEGGYTEGTVYLQRADGSPQPLTGVDAVRLSEILRSVDLLVSAGSFAWCAGHAHDHDSRQVLNRLYDQPLGRTGRLRRAALRRVLATHIASGRIELGDRRLRLDGYDIHLATGRVTREGEPVDLALPTGRRAVPLPFLPYDEVLLERVVHTVSHLLSNSPVPHRVGSG